MGKRIELTEIYRPKKAKAEKPIVSVSVTNPLYLFGKPSIEVSSHELLLAHKRAVKAAQMRRYRARKKEG